MLQTFTLLNNGNAAYNITLITFTTPAGLTHRADLSNFGGPSNFTGTSYICLSAMAPGQSKTFDLQYNYVSGASDTRYGSVTFATDSAASTILSTTIKINGGGIVTPTISLPGQGSYSAVREDATNPTSSIRMILRPNGSMRIELVDGNDFDGYWISPGPINGIGNNYWVRFTRTIETGQVGTYNSSPTTGWLKLDVNREVLVSATGSTNGSAAAVNTGYIIEIASDSSGSTILASGNYLLDVSSTKSGNVNSFGNITVEKYYGFLSNDDNFSLIGISVMFTPDGKILQGDLTNFNVEPIKGYWFLNGTATTGNNYWIRAISTCGARPGNLNTWLRLDQGRVWGFVAAPGTPLSGQIRLEIATSPSISDIVVTGYVNILTADVASNVIACEFPGTIYNYTAPSGGGTGIVVRPIQTTSVVLNTDIFNLDALV